MPAHPPHPWILLTAVLCAEASGQAPGVPPPLPPPVLFPGGSAPTPAAPAKSSIAPQAQHSPAPAKPDAAKPIAAQPGPWKHLLDGTTAPGLKGVQKSDFLSAGWKIRGGTLSLSKEIRESGRKTGGDLVTTEAYENFELSFQWKLDVAGRSGVMYLVRPSMGAVPAGHLFPLVDDVRHPDGLKGGPVKRTGSLYGVLPPGGNKRLNDVNWNQGRILVQGNHVEHWINDEPVLSYELGSTELKKAVLACKEKLGMYFGTKFESPIVLLDAGEDIAFRELKIRQLPSL